MVARTIQQLNKIQDIKSQVQGIHPALEKIYPVVMGKNNHLLIYDVNQAQEAYHFIKTVPSPMPIPVGTRAAFPLESYGQRITCVVTPEIFNALDGYITILHEFVHCFQYETCEHRLKMSLDVAKRAQETGNSMWEIDYPFPYNGLDFIRPYSEFLDATQKKDVQKIQSTRKQLKTYLGIHDYEYMVWQEWKEGLARWVENQVREHFGLAASTKGFNQPYSRVTFYAGGSAYIDYFASEDPRVVMEIEGLFKKMAAI